MKARELDFEVSERIGSVTALLVRPVKARALLVYAHGAGAGMRHAFMETSCEKLAARGIATLRYQFPYTEQGKRAPNPPAVLTATVAAAVRNGSKLARGLPLFAGGKSMGGRMTSLAASEGKLLDLRGIVFFGFPLHAAGKPSADRGAHLADVECPTLFLQGTRDKLAELELLQPLCRDLGARATLHIIEDGDHSFHVPKRSGRGDNEVLEEIADTIASWAAPLLG
jgi:predicted alpha/beta-hydrolase family hydrolase